MELNESEKLLKEMQVKTKGMSCSIHHHAPSITLVGYPGEVVIKTCCKEFGDRIADVCDVVQGNFPTFLN